MATSASVSTGISVNPLLSSDPEAALLIRETVEAIRKHFEDDAAATAVINCMAKGLKGPQILKITGITKRQLTSTVKPIRHYARRGDYDDV